MTGVKKLQDEEGYRARVGNYRILYTIDNGAVVVEVSESVIDASLSRPVRVSVA